MAAEPRPVPPVPSEEIADVDLDALASALAAALPGLAVLDRALEFDDGARADLAGVDATGRLVLARVAGEDAERSAIEALDLLSFVRRNRGLVARHLASPKVLPALEARVLIVLEPSDERLRTRLAPLIGRGLELFELRLVKSASGRRTYLVALARESVLETGGSDASRASAALERFLDALPPEREEVARLLCSRMVRLDDELRLEATADSLAWFFQGELLVRVDAGRGRLVAAVGPRGRAREIASLRDADQVLEEALARLMGEAKDEEPPEEGTPGRRSESALALLTPEEIEAFRSPD